MLKAFIPQVKTIEKKHNKVYPEIEFKLKFDGCSKNNPGLAGAGYCIYKNDKELYVGSVFLGKNVTNNYAEYSALLLGLQKAIDIGIKSLIVEGDSLLVINQMTDKNLCKSKNLIIIYKEAKELTKKFEEIYFHHIYRDENYRADELCNNAVTEYLQKNCKKCILHN
jgi:ribonuclease HI